MNQIYRLTLILFALVFTACASEEKQEPSAKKGEMIGIRFNKSTSDEERIYGFFQKKASVNYKEDQISFGAELSIPEVIIPMEKEKDAKTTAKPIPYDGYAASNGNVCVSSYSTSQKKVDYSKDSWSAEIIIDGKSVPTDLRLNAMQSLAANKPPVDLIGYLSIVACSKGKFNKVAKVEFKMKDKSKNPIVAFEWAAPWPPLHVN